MKIQKRSLPIYYGYLVIIVADDFHQVMKKYKLEFIGDVTDYGAFAWDEKDKNGHNQYFICVPSLISNHLIAHEVVHLVNFIFLHTHVELDRINDEPQAYLTGWVFKQIEDFLNRK